MRNAASDLRSAPKISTIFASPQRSTGEPLRAALIGYARSTLRIKRFSWVGCGQEVCGVTVSRLRTVSGSRPPSGSVTHIPGYAVLIGVAQRFMRTAESLGEHLEIIGQQVALRSGTQIRCPA